MFFVSNSSYFTVCYISGPLTPVGFGRFYLYYIYIYYLREFVLTTVILAPGACGWVARNDGCGSSRLAGLAGLAGLACSRDLNF